MRTRFLFPLLLIGLATASCDSNDSRGIEPIPGADRPVELHFQSWFTGERAIAEINGYRVFEGELTTNAVIGLAEIAEVEVAEGEQRLRIAVAGFEATTTFTVGDEPMYVGIILQPPVDDPPVEFIGVRLDVSDEPFLYY